MMPIPCTSTAKIGKSWPCRSRVKRDTHVVITFQWKWRGKNMSGTYRGGSHRRMWVGKMSLRAKSSPPASWNDTDSWQHTVTHTSRRRNRSTYTSGFTIRATLFHTRLVADTSRRQQLTKHTDSDSTAFSNVFILFRVNNKTQECHSKSILRFTLCGITSISIIHLFPLSQRARWVLPLE